MNLLSKCKFFIYRLHILPVYLHLIFGLIYLLFFCYDFYQICRNLEF